VLDFVEVLDEMAPEPGPAPNEAEDAVLPTLAKNDSFFDSGFVPTASEEGEPVAFGEYEIQLEIGRGGMGVVYKARQPKLDRTVALKTILAGQLATDEQVSRFRDEARTAARLRHPNIVAVYDVGEQAGRHFFTMDFVEGESLAQLLARGPMKSDDAATMMTVIARAVQYLHDHRVIHRDLKPSNILIDEEGRPLVTDFGLAKAAAEGAQDAATTGLIAGTPSYMSPEQASGGSQGTVSESSDVYSLGAILYEMLAGRPPFRGETPLDTMIAVMEGRPEPPRVYNRKISKALQRICMKCLEKNPQRRYGSAAELADDLQRYLHGEPTQARTGGPIWYVMGWARRKPALASRIGALGLFFGVATMNFFRGAIDKTYYVQTSYVLLGWLIMSIVCQRLHQNRRLHFPARFLWGAIDTILLLFVLLISDGPASPLVVAYLLLIVSSGLWFRVRFVTMITCLSILSYGILLFDYYLLWRPESRAMAPMEFDEPIIMLLAMIVIGGVTAHLVARVRTLTSIYEKEQK